MITQNFSPASGNFTFALQSALGAYSSEMYTNARKLSGTGIVGSSAEVNTSTETFIGQARFFKPYTSQSVNVASMTSAGEGPKQGYTSDFLTYVKTVRTHGAQEINVQKVVTQIDGLAKIARDFGEVRAQDEHNAILSVLQGVARSEAAYGSVDLDTDANQTDFAGGIANFGYNYTAGVPTVGQGTGTGRNADAGFGFYVDVNAAGTFGNAATTAANTRSLVYGLRQATLSDQAGSTFPGYMGAALGSNLFKALSLGFADYEPDYMYMITSPELLTQLRVANLLDETSITDGNLNFNTIFSGKFRLITTRADQGNYASFAGVNDLSTRTTFLVKPGSVTLNQLEVPMPVEMYRNANTYNGAGSTDIWYRWGYVAHPQGYSWSSTSQSAFVTNDQLAASATVGPAQGADAAPAWVRKFNVLNLGILPIFHS